MKKKLISTYLFLTIIFCTFNVDDCLCQWVQMSNGIGNNRAINTFTQLGNLIIAGTLTNGVFISSNNGENWLQTSLSDKEINVLSVKGNTILAGVNDGIYISIDNGGSWSFISLNMEYGEVTSFAVSGNNIFAGTRGPVPNAIYGVFISTNNGIDWTHTNINDRIISLASSDNILYAGMFNSGFNYGLYHSTNSGANWIQSNLDAIANCFTISGSNAYLGAEGISNGVYRSTNNGINWMQTGLSNKYILSLASSGNNLFAGTMSSDSGFYISTNNGQNWKLKNEGFGYYPQIKSLIIVNDYIFAGTTDKSVWRRPLSELITNTQNISSEVPKAFLLEQNYPNPFNPSTIIKFNIKDSRFITLKIYDLLGKEVITLVNENLKSGTYEVPFSINQLSDIRLSSGIYFYSLYADGIRIDTKRMVLVK